MKKYFFYNNTEICYYVLGNKNNKPCLFLHGWASSSELWANIFEPLKRKYCLIFIDFPPFGSSAELKIPWGLKDYVDATLTILHKLNIHSLNVIAHSFGFRVAICLCASKVNVEKLISICGAGIEKKSFKVKCKILLFKIKKVLAKFKLISQTKLQKLGSLDYKDLSPIMKQTFTNIVNCDLTNLLKNINAHTLLLYAKDDTQINIKSASIYNKKIRNSELYIFDSGGHFLFLTQQIAVYNAIKLFLKG